MPESDVALAVLVEALGPFAGVHLDLFDGRWTPSVWDAGGGPDAFETEIGNRVAHAVPLWERDGAFAALVERGERLARLLATWTAAA